MGFQANCFPGFSATDLDDPILDYPKMFHDWIIMTDLKESQDAIAQVARLVNDHT
jgi:hypothetical protein